MKKFISFVMAAAMVASLVPATAFAATYDVNATAKVVNAWTRDKDFGGDVTGSEVPELQMKVSSVDYKNTTGKTPVADITVSLGNAKFQNPKVKVVADGQTPSATVEYTYTEVASTKAEYLKIAGDYYFNGKIDSDYVIIQNSDLGTYTSSKGSSLKTWLNTYKADGTFNYGPQATSATVEAQKEAVFNTHKAELGATGDNWADFTFIANSPMYGQNVYVKAANGHYFTLAQLEALNGGAFVATTETRAVWEARMAGVTFPPAGWTMAEESVENKLGGTSAVATAVIHSISSDRTEATIRVTGYLAKDDVISLDLSSVMDKTSKNATVSVESDDIVVSMDDVPYVVVADQAFTASVKKTVAIAEEEITYLHENGLKLKETVVGTFAKDQEVTLKLSKGFEFVKTDVEVNGVPAVAEFDGNEVTFKLTNAMLTASGAVGNDDLITLRITSDVAGTTDGLKIESTSAKAGDKATITVRVANMDKVVVEVAEVVDYKVVMSVDEDEDVPVIYSGVNVNNDGITDDSDHETLEITLKETFPGAWSSRQGFNITLPEGVYVTNVDVTGCENFYIDGAATPNMTTGDWYDAFVKAYQDGDHANFEFGKRVFDDVNVTLADEPAELTFVLTLVADPGFEGDVKVGFEGALVDSQEVVAAKFVAPYTVAAEQNDLKIDSRYTEIPTDIVVKETADGLWDDGAKAATFTFNIEKSLISFEDDATFTVDKDSELEIKDTQKDATLSFYVKDVSDTAATVTISDMQLFMERNIPAGAYALELNTSMADAYNKEDIFAAKGDDKTVGDVNDYSKVVKDKFINVITAPRDEDGFTTKISVPVGESYIIAGEKKVEIDTPAYINGAGYTMLPLRAVAVALGIDNNSVLWDQATRTATILYGNRVVSMQNGANVMYINGQAVATKAGVEITNDRVFLSLRDLGTAMNVTDISWDAATRTAYLNYGGEAEA